jgi:glucose-6-phosphate isomerase, archaeal
MIPESLSRLYDPDRGAIADAPQIVRRLSDLRGCFLDRNAYDASLQEEDRVVYTVSSVEPTNGDGQLHYGLGVLMPGKIGDEYFMTKGHYHAWRPAAEVYLGLRGEGCMLLEDEATGETRLERLAADSIVYVPGHAAHRTINTGSVPLAYIGIYPSAAGHDYASLAERNFRMALVERDGQPTLLERPKR